MESFFGTLKNECLHHYKFKTRAKARAVTFEYIEVFYNRIRRHAKLKNQTPADFAKLCIEKIERNAAYWQYLPVHEIGPNSPQAWISHSKGVRVVSRASRAKWKVQDHKCRTTQLTGDIDYLPMKERQKHET